MSFFVYILKTSGNTLYIGQTKNVEKRLTQHRQKKGPGAKYLRLFTSFELVYTEAHRTRSEALKREWELKQLSRKEKMAFIEDNPAASSTAN